MTTPIQPSPSAANEPGRSSDFATGLVVGLSNPKAMLFHASLMPLVIDLPTYFAGVVGE